ncbi:hypothetical protein [Ruminococcus sp.]
MKRKKMTFSLKMLWEGFRQCKMIGIFAAVIIVLGAVLAPVAQVIGMSGSPYHTKIVYEAWSANPVMLLVLVAAPLMTLILFHFLDSRAASDLYHALPHKRITLYLSYAGAVLTWVVLLLVLGTLASLITCSFTHNYIALLKDSLLPFAVSLFCISFLMISGILVSMSITGTVFTNILFSGILLFLPRFCAYALQKSVQNALPFLSETSGTGFFRNANNLLFSGVGGALGLIEDGSFSVESILSPGWQPLLYTFLLGAVYFLIAAFLFCRRRSEAAGQSAPSRLLQHIYRIVVTMTICIFIVCILYMDLVDHTAHDNWFMYLILYLAAALVYFAYELITTRKWHNLLTALPGLGIVALLNVGILLGLHMVQNHIVAQRPAMQEIESVSFCNTDGNEYVPSSSYLSYQDYVNLECRDIEITDPTAITLVSYYLDENLKTWEESASAYEKKYRTSVSDTYEAYAESDESALTNRNDVYYAYNVIIRTKDKTLNRLIYVPVAETEKLLSALQSNQAYVDAWRNPPEEIDGTATLSDHTGVYYLSADQAEELLQSDREELQTVDFERLYQQVQNGAVDDTWVSAISYSFRKNGKLYTLDCPIYEGMTPKTAKKFYEMIYEAQKDDAAFLRQLTENSDKDISYSINAYGGDDTAHAGYYAFASDIAQLNKDAAVQLLMQYVQDRPMQAGDSYATIYLWADEGLSDDTQSLDLQLPLDDAFFSDEKITDLFDIDNYNEDGLIDNSGEDGLG